jgi:hypothetical protein
MSKATLSVRGPTIFAARVGTIITLEVVMNAVSSFVRINKFVVVHCFPRRRYRRRIVALKKSVRGHAACGKAQRVGIGKCDIKSWRVLFYFLDH